MSKILNTLRSVDGMARPVSLTLNGSFTHATAVGGVMTLLAYTAVIGWYIYATLSAIRSQPTVSTQSKPIDCFNRDSNCEMYIPTSEIA